MAKYTDLDQALANPTDVTELDLRGNEELESLPVEIGQLTDLTNLNLGGNNLENLPSEIGQLTDLTYLGLNSNNLETYHPIEKLTNLIDLHMDEAGLTLDDYEELEELLPDCDIVYSE